MTVVVYLVSLKNNYLFKYTLVLTASCADKILLLKMRTVSQLELIIWEAGGALYVLGFGQSCYFFMW